MPSDRRTLTGPGLVEPSERVTPVIPTKKVFFSEVFSNNSSILFINSDLLSALIVTFSTFVDFIILDF